MMSNGGWQFSHSPIRDSEAKRPSLQPPNLSKVSSACKMLESGDLHVLDRNGGSGDIWYECPNCRCYLQHLAKFITHVDSLNPLKAVSQCFPVTPDRSTDSIINQVQDDAQLFIPKEEMVLLNETYNKYLRQFCKELKVTLPRLTDYDINSIKSNLSKAQTFPSSSSPEGSQICGGYDCNISTSCSSSHPKNFSHSVSKKRRNRKPSAPCELCGKILSSPKGLKKHLAAHYKNDKSYRCEICRKKFVKEEDLAAHSNLHKEMEEKEKLKTLECNVCKRRFLHRETLVRHRIKHRDSNPYRCKLCGLNSISRYNLQRHYAIHFDQEKHECSICGLKFARTEGLRLHIVKIHSVTSDPTFQQKVHQHKKRLDRIRCKTPLYDTTPPKQVHVDLGTGKVKIENYAESGENQILSTLPEPLNLTADIPESLPEDGTPTISQLDLSVIFSISGVLNAFPCKLCPTVSFSRFYALRVHMKNNHPKEYAQENKPKALSLICTDCGQTYPSTQELSSHMKTAHCKSLPSVTGTGPKWIRCTKCGCRCKDETRLNRHINVMHNSTGQPKHECQMCHKEYTTVKLLRYHQRNYCDNGNEGEEKPKCPHCGKIVANQKVLKSHRRLHNPSRKPSVCKLCNQQCSCAQSLKRHIRLVHGNGIYRPNKEKQRKIQIETPIAEDELFL